MGKHPVNVNSHWYYVCPALATRYFKFSQQLSELDMFLSFGRARHCLSLPGHSGKIHWDHLSIKQKVKGKTNREIFDCFILRKQCVLIVEKVRKRE